MRAIRNLNDRQLRAVEHPGGPLLVLAGPGTGKTGVLVARISHLVGEKNVRPERILALTFSRRAADEMSERVRSLVPEAALVETRTFHSFALSVVRRYPAASGLPGPPEIMPTGEQWALVSELLAGEDARAWGLSPGALERPATVREVYDLLLRCQEHLLEPDEMRALGEKTNLPHLGRAAGVLEKYRERLAELCRVDYEGVVRHALKRLGEDGPARRKLVCSYDHVLVDEFQDTNRSQLELVRRLAPGKEPNVFCVGDDAQSIYGFRGARAENVGEFEKHWPGARKIHLRTNYRSASGIIRLAEDAIAADESRPPREEQRAAPTRAGTVVHEVLASPREEGEWISERIVELNRARGVPFEEMAILRRSLLDARPLVDALASRGIPLDVAAAGSAARHLALFLEASAGEEPAPIPAVAALCSLLVGLSPSSARALRTAAGATGRSVFGLLRSGDRPVGVPQEEADRARRAVAALDEAGSKEGLLEKLDALWKGLPGVRGLFERHAEDPDAARTLGDVAAFLRSARAYAKVSKQPDVAGFLRAGKMAHEDSDTWKPTAPPAEGAVRLLTVHSSKGLEFEAVFLSGLAEDRFPVRSRGVRLVDPGLLLGGEEPTPRIELEKRHLNEERRLLYVAITRAKTYLCLTGVEEKAEDGAKVSPFLRELEGRLAELRGRERERRFWASREEAVEELRRAAFDANLPRKERFVACRALLEAGERPVGDPPGGWWPYLQKTAGTPPEPVERLRVRSWEVLAHLDCPRKAFFERFFQRKEGAGRVRFGAAFKEGFGRYLSGGREGSFEEAVLAAVREKGFGGPALDEYWERQARETLGSSSCESWAAEVRAALVVGEEDWSFEAGGHEVWGTHGPVIEENGERVLLRVSTSKHPAAKAAAAEDPSLALQALGARTAGAKLVYPRKPSRGKPAERTLSAAKEWRETFAGEVRRSLAEMAAGEMPARPRSEETCGRCAFRAVCPRHAEDEPWLA